MRYRRRLPGALRLLALALISTHALAGDDASLPFIDAGDAPTVLSATRLSQSLFETPASVTVIDRQMIEQSGMREIPELLRLVPGMVVGYESGSEAFVSFHGTSADLARRMQVLVDGRSIYQPLLASVDWIGLPLELADIERIEVIRGPNSATWGANSFFAVVNIVTRHPADVERGRISYRAGQDGIEDYHARLAQRSGAVDWRLSVAGRADDGFTVNRRRGNADFYDSKSVDSLHGRAVWAGGSGSSLDVSFGVAGMDAQQQYRPTFFVQPPVAERENQYLSLAWDQDFGESNHLRVQASQSRFSRDEPWLVNVPRLAFNPVLGDLYRQNRLCANGFALGGGDISECGPADFPFLAALFPLVDPSDPLFDPLVGQDTLYRSGLDARERRTEVEVHDTWMPRDDFRAVFGVDYDEAEVDSRVYLGGSGENTVWRAFLHAEWRLAPSWLLNIGGNQEWDEGAGDYFSPRYALNWQFADNHVLRAVYSEAVRTPDLLEDQAQFAYIAVAVDPADSVYSGRFFQSGYGNGQAPTEEIATTELSYYGRFDPAGLALDLRVFEDQLALSEHNLDPTDTEGFEIRPTRNMRMRGVEFGSDWRPVPGQRFQLNYAYLNLEGVTRADDNSGFVPMHSGSVAWWQDYGDGFQFSMAYVFYNDLRDDRDFFFDRLDHRIARTFRLGGQQRLTLAAVLQSRLTDDCELREENAGDRNRGWFSIDWNY